MAVDVVMPRLGWTMEEGTLVEWSKNDGDAVSAGEVIMLVESDKAVTEVESFDDGILRIPPGSPAPGSTVPIGTFLAFILQPGEEMPEAPTGVAPATEVESAQASASSAAAPQPLPGQGTAPARAGAGSGARDQSACASRRR